MQNPGEAGEQDVEQKLLDGREGENTLNLTDDIQIY
jgi:hypothetical protein